MARVRVTYDEDATSTLIIYLPMQLISEDVDVGECSSATKDADATSRIPSVGEDVA
jgi:hypothetical protein